jgi:hypothetical protein
MVAETVAIAALDATAEEGGEEVAIAGADEGEVVGEDEVEDAIAVEVVEEEVSGEGEEEVVVVVETNVMNAPIVLLLMVTAVVMFEEGEAAVVSWDEGSVEVEVVESVTLREFLAYSMLIPLLVGCWWNSIPAQKALSLSVPARIG